MCFKTVRSVLRSRELGDKQSGGPSEDSLLSCPFSGGVGEYIFLHGPFSSGHTMSLNCAASNLVYYTKAFVQSYFRLGSCVLQVCD